MIPTTENEKKKPVVPAPVPADPQTAEVVQPAQTTSQQATPAPVAKSVEQPATTPVQSARQAVAGYGDVTPYLAPLHAAQRDQDAYLKQIEEIDRRLPQSIEEYRRTGRNPLADIVLARQKPVRNVDEETRLRHNAKLQALNNMFSLIGKGIAATGGLRPAPVDNRPIYDIQSRLRQLDEIYRQEGLRYDQNTLMSALRKDQANLQAVKAEVDALSARRKGYIDLYKDELKHNRQLAEKAAELGVKAAQYRTEMGYKYDDLKEKKRHNQAGERLGWARYNAANPKTLIRDYRTGKHIELSPEVQADLIGVIAQAINQRESAKKSGGDTYLFGDGSGQGSIFENDENGKRPLPLNNYFTDEEIKAFQKTGKISAFSQASLSRLYNDLQSGEFYDPTGVPSWIPALPDSKTYYVPSQKTDYLNGVSETLVGLMQSDILNGGDGKFTPKIVRDHLGGGIANISDSELSQIIDAATAKLKKITNT